MFKFLGLGKSELPTESAVGENRRCRQNRQSGEIGVGSGIGRRGLEIFLSDRQSVGKTEILCRNCHPDLIRYDIWYNIIILDNIYIIFDNNYIILAINVWNLSLRIIYLVDFVDIDKREQRKSYIVMREREQNVNWTDQIERIKRHVFNRAPRWPKNFLKVQSFRSLYQIWHLRIIDNNNLILLKLSFRSYNDHRQNWGKR